MRAGLLLSLFTVACLSRCALSQQIVTTKPFMAELLTSQSSLVTGKQTTIEVVLMTSASMAPQSDLKVMASLSMPGMTGMEMPKSDVSTGYKPGHYLVRVTFNQPGTYKLNLYVSRADEKATILAFTITPGSASKSDEALKPTSHSMPGMPDMQDKQNMQNMQGMPAASAMAMMPMKASFGNWSVNRESSGTSWQPDSAPMFMKMLSHGGRFEIGTMGILQGGYVDDGGKRGDKGLFSNSMIMVMGRMDLGGGSFGLHLMTSLDPYLNGQRGVPNLFENGFAVHGVDVADRKDPHNLFAELAISYSHPLSKSWTGFIYGGPSGEPALGNGMYLHRTSGLEIPEAPISHDWFDGSHISFGVATVGLAYQNRWKIEASAFNSAEPTDDLYGIGAVKLNSASGRLSYNPGQDWSLAASYGHIKSDVNTHRMTLSAGYSHNFSHGDNLSVTGYFGQNIVQGSANSNAWLAEATYYHAREAFFTRFERVDKDELVNVPAGVYTVNKIILGAVHTICTKDHFDYGLGAYIGVYSFPHSLNSIYGSSPITFGLFFRIRPGKM